MGFREEALEMGSKILRKIGLKAGSEAVESGRDAEQTGSFAKRLADWRAANKAPNAEYLKARKAQQVAREEFFQDYKSLTKGGKKEVDAIRGKSVDDGGGLDKAMARAKELANLKPYTEKELAQTAKDLKAAGRKDAALIVSQVRKLQESGAQADIEKAKALVSSLIPAGGAAGVGAGGAAGGAAKSGISAGTALTYLAPLATAGVAIFGNIPGHLGSWFTDSCDTENDMRIKHANDRNFFDLRNFGILPILVGGGNQFMAGALESKQKITAANIDTQGGAGSDCSAHTPAVLTPSNSLWDVRNLVLRGYGLLRTELQNTTGGTPVPQQAHPTNPVVQAAPAQTQGAVSNPTTGGQCVGGKKYDAALKMEIGC